MGSRYAFEAAFGGIKEKYTPEVSEQLIESKGNRPVPSSEFANSLQALKIDEEILWLIEIWPKLAADPKRQIRQILEGI